MENKYVGTAKTNNFRLALIKAYEEQVVKLSDKKGAREGTTNMESGVMLKKANYSVLHKCCSYMVTFLLT